MPKLPIISWQQLEKIFKIKGYEFLKQNGSHRSYYDTTNPAKIIVLIAQKEIPKGTLKDKIRKLGITNEEFFDLLSMTK